MDLTALLQFLSGPKAEAMPAIGPVMPSTPQYNLPAPNPFNVDTGARDAEREAMLRILGQAPPMIGPVNPTQPAFRTPDAIAAALALAAAAFGGKKGGEIGGAIAGGWMDGKNRKAQADTDFNQQSANFKNQQAMQRQGQEFNLAKTKLGFAEDDLQDQIRQNDYAIKQSEQALRATQVDIEKARMGYQNANTEGEKDFWAQRLRTIDPQNAPTEEMVQADKSQMKAGRVNNALTRWNTLSRNWTNDYGELNETQVAQATKARDAIAAEFMVDAESLPLPFTGSTLKKQMQDQKIADLQLKGLKTIDDSARAWAKLQADSEYRVKKLEADAARALQTGNTAAFNANTRRMEAERKAASDQSNKIATGKVNTAQAKINGLKEKQRLEPSESKRRTLEQQIKAAAAERDFWKQQIGEDVAVGSKPSVGTSTFKTAGGNAYQFDTSK